MLKINHSAAVFDFLEARLPFTTLYLPLKFQNSRYPLPIKAGRYTLKTSFCCFILNHLIAGTLPFHTSVCFSKPLCKPCAMTTAFRNRVIGKIAVNQFMLFFLLGWKMLQAFFSPFLLGFHISPVSAFPILQGLIPPRKEREHQRSYSACHSIYPNASQ